MQMASAIVVTAVSIFTDDLAKEVKHMPDFVISDGLGHSETYTAVGNCYQDAKQQISSILDAGQTPIVDRHVLESIEYTTGKFSYDERKKLGLE